MSDTHPTPVETALDADVALAKELLARIGQRLGRFTTDRAYMMVQDAQVVALGECFDRILRAALDTATAQVEAERKVSAWLARGWADHIQKLAPTLPTNTAEKVLAAAREATGWEATDG